VGVRGNASLLAVWGECAGLGRTPVPCQREPSKGTGVILLGKRVGDREGFGGWAGGEPSPLMRISDQVIVLLSGP